MVALLVGWVGECYSELGNRIVIPQSNTKEFFCWDILGMLLRVNGEEQRQWCGLGMVVILAGGEG